MTRHHLRQRQQSLPKQLRQSTVVTWSMQIFLWSVQMVKRSAQTARGSQLMRARPATPAKRTPCLVLCLHNYRFVLLSLSTLLLLYHTCTHVFPHVPLVHVLKSVLNSYMFSDFCFKILISYTCLNNQSK